MNRAITEEDLTHTIAIYVNKYGGASTNDVCDWIEEDADYIRASEPLEITFTALPDEVVLEGRVKSIDAEIQKVRAEFTVRIDDLKDQKNRLLAITHEVDE